MTGRSTRTAGHNGWRVEQYNGATLVHAGLRRLRKADAERDFDELADFAAKAGHELRIVELAE
jgi:hypothetical protein